MTSQPISIPSGSRRPLTPTGAPISLCGSPLATNSVTLAEVEVEVEEQHKGQPEMRGGGGEPALITLASSSASSSVAADQHLLHLPRSTAPGTAASSVSSSHSAVHSPFHIGSLPLPQNIPRMPSSSTRLDHSLKASLRIHTPPPHPRPADGLPPAPPPNSLVDAASSLPFIHRRPVPFPSTATATATATANSTTSPTGMTSPPGRWSLGLRGKPQDMLPITSSPPPQPLALSQSMPAAHFLYPPTLGSSPSPSSALRSKQRSLSRDTNTTNGSEPSSSVRRSVVSSLPRRSGLQPPQLHQQQQVALGALVANLISPSASPPPPEDEFINVEAERVLDVMSRSEIVQLLQSLVASANPLDDQQQLQDRVSGGTSDHGGIPVVQEHFLEIIQSYAGRVLDVADILEQVENREKATVGQDSTPPPFIPPAEPTYTQQPPQQPLQHASLLKRSVVKGDRCANNTNGQYTTNNTTNNGDALPRKTRVEEVEEMVQKARELCVDSDLDRILSVPRPLPPSIVADSSGKFNSLPGSRGTISQLAPPPGTPIPSPPDSPPETSSLLSHLLSTAVFTPPSGPASKTVHNANTLSALELYVENHAFFPMAARHRPRLYQTFQVPRDVTTAAAPPPPPPEDIFSCTVPVLVTGTAGYEENECELFFAVQCRRTGKTGTCGMRELVGWETTKRNASLLQTVQDACDALLHQ